MHCVILSSRCTVERHEKDNGPLTLWGGSTASIATRRCLAEEGTGESAGRSTSRSRSARIRPSNLLMQVSPKVYTSAKGDVKLTATGSARRSEGVVPYLNLRQRQEHDKNSIAEEEEEKEEEVHLEEIMEENDEDEEMHIIGKRSASRPLPHGTDNEDKSLTPPLLPKRVELSAVQPGAATRYTDDVCESKTDMDSSLLIVKHDKNCSREQGHGQAQRGEDETKEGEGQGQGHGAVPASPRLEVRVDSGVSTSTASNESRKMSQRGQHTGNGRMIGSKVTAIPPFRYERKVRESQSDTHGGALIVRDIGAVQGNATAAARALRDTNREGGDGSSSSSSRQNFMIDGTAPSPSPTPHCDRSSGSRSRGPGSSAGDIASTSTSTGTIVTESIDGDVAKNMKSEKNSVAAKHDLKLFKKRRQAEMRRRAVEEVENEEDSYDDVVRREVLPLPYAQLSLQDILPAEKIEERKVSERLISDALKNPTVRSQSKNNLVPPLNLASCHRNTRSNLATAPTTTTTVTTVPSTITNTVTAAAAASGSLDSHSGEEEINDRGGQVKKDATEKEKEEQKVKEKEMRGRSPHIQSLFISL